MTTAEPARPDRAPSPAPSTPSRATYRGLVGGRFRDFATRLRRDAAATIGQTADQPAHQPGLIGFLGRELGIAEATVVVMASFAISAGLGAVRQVLFNAQFGAGPEAAAYYAAFRLPDILFSLIAGGALSSAMIPVLLSTASEDGAEAARRLTNVVLTTLFTVTGAAVLIAELLAPVFVTKVLAPGFDAETSALTIVLTRIMLLQPLILAVGSVALAVLNSRNRFLLTALSYASHNVALIVGILATRIHPEIGIYGPTLGVIGGAVMQVGIVLPGLWATGFRFRPIWDRDDPRLNEVVRLLIPNSLSLGVNYAGSILDTSVASVAPETAGLPAIHNAWLLIWLPVALIGQAVGQSAFPRLAARASAGQWLAMRRLLIGALAVALALALPAVAAAVWLGRPTIHVLFEHGRFDAAAGALTYDLLAIYALGLPGYVATEVLTRSLIAMRDTRTPLLTNATQLCTRGALLMMLVGEMGVRAVPVAFALTASLEAMALATVAMVKIGRRLRRTPVSSAC